MSDAGYLWHVTLDTGNMRRSPRTEVDDATIDLLRPTIRDALTGIAAPIPTLSDISLSAHTIGPHGLLTIHDDRTRAPLALVAIATRARGAVRVWTMIHARLPPSPASHIGDPPAAPWCAVLLFEAVARRADMIPVLSDLERCLAWTWIERPI